METYCTTILCSRLLNKGAEHGHGARTRTKLRTFRLVVERGNELQHHLLPLQPKGAWHGRNPISYSSSLQAATRVEN